MDFTMVIPVLIAFVLSVAAGPVVIPVLRRLKMDHLVCDCGHFADLCKRVSEGDSGTFCNDWIRTGRVPG